MIDTIAWILCLTLLLVSSLHLLWASGSTWPVANERELIRYFIGLESLPRPPGPALTTAVALLIAIAAITPLWAIELIALPLPRGAKDLTLWTLFAIFLLRGLSTYLLPRLPRCQPFKSLDRKYFAPLCLALALGFLSIALNK